MSTWILIVLVGAGAWFQRFCDPRTIASMTEPCRWSISSLRWSPFARTFSSRRIAPAHGVIFMALAGYVAGLRFEPLRNSREER
jgi:hypothetical protein